MKHLLTFLLALVVSVSSTSCKNLGNGQLDMDPQRLAKIGNFALTAATVGGVVNPAQADVIRKGGKLILDSTDHPDVKLATLSDAVVDYAESNGDISHEQADALRQAGTVDLKPAPGPVNTLLPAANP